MTDVPPPPGRGPRAAGRAQLARPRGGALRRLAAARRRRVHRTGQLGAGRRRPAGADCRTPSPPSPAGTRERGLRPRAQVPVPGAEAADAAFAAAGWTRTTTTWCSPRPWTAGPNRPSASTSRRRRTTPGSPATATAAPRCRRWPATCWSTPTTRCSPRALRPGARPLAAVARGVLVDGWLCVTAVTVDERYRRRGLATAVMAGLGAWARERGGHSRLCRWPAATPRRWPSTSGWASPSTTATTTGWVPSRSPARPRAPAAGRRAPADGERRRQSPPAAGRRG